jgi:hypothetical protein
MPHIDPAAGDTLDPVAHRGLDWPGRLQSVAML